MGTFCFYLRICNLSFGTKEIRFPAELKSGFSEIRYTYVFDSADNEYTTFFF